MTRWNPHDALLNASPELSLVLEVNDVHDVPSPELLREVPDLLHCHELAAVDAVEDDGHTVLFTHRLQVLVGVDVEVVQYQRARLLCDLTEAFDEGIEAISLVTLLPRLTDHHFTSVVYGSNRSYCFKGKLRSLDARPL